MHDNIRKTPIYDKGYLNAEVWSPKMEPGQCRITLEELPPVYKNHFETNKFCIRRGSLKLKTISSKYDKNYLYYYWMIENPSEIKKFEVSYTVSYKYINKYKYPEMLRALQDAYKLNSKLRINNGY